MHFSDLAASLSPPPPNTQAQWVKALLPPKQLAYAIRLVLVTGALGLSAVVLLVLGYVLRSPTFGWTGGFVLAGGGGGRQGCKHLAAALPLLAPTQPPTHAPTHPPTHGHTHPFCPCTQAAA